MAFRILIVDDDEAIRALVCVTLEEYELLEAVDGARGLAMACTEQPDLILLDRQMPHLDGLEALRTLQENESTASIPVVILSSLSEVDDRVTGLSAGAIDYIAKPFSPPELAARVKSALRQVERWRGVRSGGLSDTTVAVGHRDGVAPSKHLRAGTLIDGKYRILNLIEEGGMGVVYHAEQELLEREVAVKLIRSTQMARPSFQMRFFREARLGSRLDHPCFPRVYDFGRTREGDLYMASEFVRGRTLQDLAAHEGPFEPRYSVELIARLLEGLAVAHAIGIVHRDIKPSNLMLDREGELKILDLGLAKDLGSETDPHVTRAGASIGTPLYLSPEQATGSPSDERSDIYSVGIVLYELLCGQPPFLGGESSDVMRRHCVEDPLPPSHWKRIPEAIEAVVLKALQKSSKARWQTADAFREALLQALEAPSI